LIVIVADTWIGPEYGVPVVEVGIEPSVVYRMLAPDVDVDTVTLCALAYVPGAGLNVGAETVGGGVMSHPQSRIAAASSGRTVEMHRFMMTPPSSSCDWKWITGNWRSRRSTS
jgi:hypothetical protein